MATDSQNKWDWRAWAPSTIGGVLTVAQIVLLFFVQRDISGALRVLGYVAWGLSFIFGWLPIVTFRKKGGVAEGEAYIKTTRLVDTGIYAIVRHPQGGTAWLLICLSCILLSQHEWVLALALVTGAIAYLDTYQLDKRCIAKFGDPYREYMARVPRVNPIAGLIRLARRGGRGASAS